MRTYPDFLGVPFDPPGPNLKRVIRITNVRGDVTDSVDKPVYATVTIAGNPLPMNQTQVVQVATPFRGLAQGVANGACVTLVSPRWIRASAAETPPASCTTA